MDIRTNFGVTDFRARSLLYRMGCTDISTRTSLIFTNIQADICAVSFEQGFIYPNYSRDS